MIGLLIAAAASQAMTPNAFPDGRQDRGASEAQEVAWEIRASSQASLGEPLAVEAEARFPQGLGLRISLPESTTDAYAVSEAGPPETREEADKSVFTFRLEILPLETGRVPVALAWEAGEGPSRRILKSPPFFLDVKEPDLGSAPALKDIKAPRAARPALWPWLLAALAAAGAWLLWRRLKARSPEGRQALPRDTRPPEVAAEAELALLESSGLWGEGRYKQFYIALTDILRRYLERRFGIPATRLTSSELKMHLRHAEIDRLVCARVREVLDRADLVKFARSLPEKGWGAEDIASARGIVRETSPRPLATVEARP